MRRSMEITVKTPGVPQGAKGLREFAAAAEEAAKAEEHLARAAEKATKAAAGPAAGGPGSSGGGLGGRKGKQDSYLQGPNQRLLKIQEQMARAAQEGNQAALEDLKILEFRARRSKELGERRLAQGDAALKGPGLLDLFQDLNGLLKSMGKGDLGGIFRGGANLLGEQLGGGGKNIEQKLLGGLLGAGGAGGGAGGAAEATAGLAEAATGATTAVASLEAAAGPAGWALIALEAAGVLLMAEFALVATGLKAFYDGVTSTARTLHELNAAARVAGGSPHEVAALSALGLSPGGAASLGAQLRQAVTVGGDPAAMLAAARLGLGPQMPQAFGGSQNNADLMLRFLERLDRVAGPEQTRLARALRMEDVLPMMDVSPFVKQGRRAAVETGDAIRGNAGPLDANDLTASVALASAALGHLGDALSSSAMRPIAEGISMFAAETEHLARAIAAHPEIGQFLGNSIEGVFKLAGAIEHVVANNLDGLAQLQKGFLGFVEVSYHAIEMAYNNVKGLSPAGALMPGLPSLKFDHHANAMDRHAEAMKQHSGWMRDTINGGGARVRGALPGGWRGQMLQDQLRQQKIVLGAFRLV